MLEYSLTNLTRTAATAVDQPFTGLQIWGRYSWNRSTPRILGTQPPATTYNPTEPVEVEGSCLDPAADNFITRLVLRGRNLWSENAFALARDFTLRSRGLGEEPQGFAAGPRGKFRVRLIRDEPRLPFALELIEFIRFLLPFPVFLRVFIHRTFALDLRVGRCAKRRAFITGVCACHFSEVC